MSCFVALLTDAEAEVRAAAVAHVARMIAWGGPTLFTSHMQPLLPALADDVVMEVRSKCAGALMDTAAQKSLDDATILQHFGPLWEAALQDEFPEVQLQVLTNLHKISALLPALHSVVTTLLSMAKASNWRTSFISCKSRSSSSCRARRCAEHVPIDIFPCLSVSPPATSTYYLPNFVRQTEWS